MMRAKICGITHLDDANLAILHGAWALGFNFYKQSPRYIEPSKAEEIIGQLPEGILKVGIVIDAVPTELSGFMATVGLDLLQVYEVMDVPLSLKQRMIMCMHAADEASLLPHDELSQYAYVLLDSPPLADGLMGGTGRLCQWDLAAILAKKYRLILAGGLTGSNILSAMRAVRPYAVDVASGVQRVPGRLSPQLLQDFLRQVRDEKNGG